MFLLGRIDLLLLDEVQHITEDRGATLETIVVRMRTLNNTYQAKLAAMAGTGPRAGTDTAVGPSAGTGTVTGRR